MTIQISVADSTCSDSSLVECRTWKSEVLRSYPAWGNILQLDFFLFFSRFCRIYKIHLHFGKTQILVVLLKGPYVLWGNKLAANQNHEMRINWPESVRLWILWPSGETGYTVSRGLWCRLEFISKVQSINGNRISRDCTRPSDWRPQCPKLIYYCSNRVSHKLSTIQEYQYCQLCFRCTIRKKQDLQTLLP